MSQTPLSVVIIDDEEGARDVLERLLILSVDQLEVVGKAEDLLSGIELINQVKPNLVFLDIEMPRHRGYRIAEYMDEINFEIIFVTAYDQYAIKAFELNAIDYILKPVNRAALTKAVEKARIQLQRGEILAKYQDLLEEMNKVRSSTIEINELGVSRILNVVDIIAIKANGAYSEIYVKTEDKPIVSSKNIGHFEKKLENDQQIFRSHKSWLINLDEVQKFLVKEEVIELTDGVEAKLSRFKKAEFKAKL
jgi:two-component system LytT family response regulator